MEDFISTSNHSTKITVLITQPMKSIARSDVIIEAPTNSNVAHRAFEITESRSNKILSIDDVTYSLQAWYEAHPPIDYQWNFQSIFKKTLKNLHLFISTSAVDPLIYTWSQISDPRCNILDMRFTKENNVYPFVWLSYVQTIIKHMI